MNKFVIATLSAVILFGAIVVRAGDGCCGAGKAAKADMKADCSAQLSKLNLTPEQQAKVTALQAECKTGGCDRSSHQKFMSGLKDILTADQMTQFKAECAKTNKGGCPLAKSDKKS